MVQQLISVESNGIHRAHWISIKAANMQISKWGNSLAIRIPADVVRTLGLKQGDELDIHSLDDRRVELVRKLTRQELLAQMKAFNLQLPADGSWKMSREEMNGADRLL